MHSSDVHIDDRDGIGGLKAVLAATGVDYLALGHRDRPMRVGNGLVPAFYSGSPELARTVNLVRLTAGEAIVTREALIWRDGKRPGGGDGGPSPFGIL